MIKVTGAILALLLEPNTVYAEVIKEYFPSGILKSEIEYKDGTRTKTSKGVKDGVEKIYYNTGQLAYVVHNVEGKRDGKLLWYEIDGQLIKETNFHLGKQEGWEKVYFPNGQLQHSVKYVDDRKEGVEKEYYSTGALASEVTFVHGKREGMYKRYHQKGYLMSDVFYKSNFKEGDERIYDAQGNIIKRERHKFDRPIDVMKKVQAKEPDATLEAFKGLNFNPKKPH